MSKNPEVSWVRRTGTIDSPVRRIEVGPADDRNGRVLSTPIRKIQWGVSFRKAGGTRPIEQYAFEVDGKTYLRFADATARVLKKHRVRFATLAGHQQYVERALAIIRGDEEFRFADVPADAVAAVGQISRVA